MEWRGNVGTHPCGVRKNQERCGKWLLESNEKSWPKTFCGCAPQVFFRTVSPTPKRFSPVICPLGSKFNSKRRSLQSNIRLRDTPGGANRASAPPVLSSRMHHAPPPRARQTPLARGSAAATPGRTHACAAGRETNGQQHPSGPPRLVVCGRGRGVSCRAGKQG